MRTLNLMLCSALLAGQFVLVAPAASDVGISVLTPRAEKRERRRYCRILERQLRPDRTIAGSANATVFGVGGRFELNYPNDLSNQYLAAHSDLVFECRRWRRGEISTVQFQEARERYIAVYMAGTNADDDDQNREALDAIMSSVSRYGFSDERRAELDEQFTAIRNSIAQGETLNLSRSEAILAALRQADDQTLGVAARLEARLDAIERILVGTHPSNFSAAGQGGCSRDFRVLFGAGDAAIDPAHPTIAQASACANQGPAEVTISGYADSATGSPRQNLRLSAERAAAVAQAFTLAGGDVSALNFEGGTARFGSRPSENRIVIITISPTRTEQAQDGPSASN